MSKSKGNIRRALANPARLKPFADDRDLLRVVIETPKGSRNKTASICKMSYSAIH